MKLLTAAVAGRRVYAISESVASVDIQLAFVRVNVAVFTGPFAVTLTLATREQALAIFTLGTQTCQCVTNKL